MFLASPRPVVADISTYRQSPLSMRDSNACPRFTPFAPHMDSFGKDAWGSRSRVRGSKYNTLLRNKDIENDKRRDLFHKKVKQQGEDRRWEVRGEQVGLQFFLKCDEISVLTCPRYCERTILRVKSTGRKNRRAGQQNFPQNQMKTWTLETYLTALEVSPHIIHRWLRLMHFAEVDHFEQYLSQEDQELTAVSSMLDEVQSSFGRNQNEMSDYGSDDEDLEILLMDAVQKMEHQTPSSPTSEPAQEHQEMDTTMG
jgi:hypothetical protein